MKLLWLYMLAYLILPIIGECFIWYTDMKISAGTVTLQLIINNSIFVLVLIFTAYIIQKYKNPKAKIIKLYNYSYANIVFKQAIVLFIFLSIIIFVLGGYKILFGLANRGAIRVSLGIFGPLHALSLSYLPVVIIIFVSVIYIHLSKIDQQKVKKKLIIIYSFTIILGILSGYKSVALGLMIPGFVILYFNNFGIKRFLFFLVIAVIILTVFTSLVRGVSISEGFAFMIYRATTMTAYGTIGVWNEFQNGTSLHNIFINFIGMLGKKIASLVLGLSPTEPEFLKTNLSRLITYMVYPDKEGALAGTVNVTVTNFGHAIYLLGNKFYIIYAIIMGIVIGLVIRAFKKFIIKGQPLKASLIGLYFFAVIIPSINSGGIFKLISFPIFIYFIFAFIVAKYFLKKRISYAI